MHEPPVDLPDAALAAGLRTHYGLAVTAVTFLPLGQDTFAWVYRVRTADDASYFLKVRTSVTNAPSLVVPRYLHDHGIAQVIAPLPTTTGALWGGPSASHDAAVRTTMDPNERGALAPWMR